MYEKGDYFFADATRDAGKVFKRNIGAILINIILFTFINTAAELMVEQTQSWVRIFISVVKTILNTSLSIALIVTTLNEFKAENPEEKRSIGSSVKRYTIPYYITSLIVAFIITITMLVMAFVLIGILTAISGTIGAIASIIMIFGIALYFGIKYAFYPQIVVLKGRYYADALNQSEKVAKGRGGTIVGIALFPALFALVPNYAIPKIPGMSTPVILTLLMFIGACVHIYSNLVMTALFLNVDYDSEPITEEVLELE